MLDIAIVGSDCTAAVARLACARFAEQVTCYPTPETAEPPATSLGANLTRILAALGTLDPLLADANVPDREQVRLAHSGYLLAELPLGSFYEDRYRGPLINVELADLRACLDATPSAATGDVAAGHSVVLQSQPKERPVTADVVFAMAVLPVEGFPRNANITWLGREQSAWQFSTPRQTYFFFATRRTELDASEWHPSLHAAIAAAEPLQSYGRDVRKDWFAGRVAYLGPACFSPPPSAPHSRFVGFEDAWVLSRMIENYEEEYLAGFYEYQRYRYPRTRKIALTTLAEVQSALLPSAQRRALRNLSIGLSTRFLPEIAMSKRDWFHNYDCIRGVN